VNVEPPKSAKPRAEVERLYPKPLEPAAKAKVERLDPKPLESAAKAKVERLDLEPLDRASGDSADDEKAAWGQAAPPPKSARPPKTKYERPARTGREPGMATVFLNVGRKQLVTPADIVGKIAGVTRLPAEIVGAIDIHQRHTLVDVRESESELVVKKLAGIKLKGIALAPVRADGEAVK
jgi:ATP-dependent RNA helicase DeaD